LKTKSLSYYLKKSWTKLGPGTHLCHLRLRQLPPVGDAPVVSERDHQLGGGGPAEGVAELTSKSLKSFSFVTDDAAE